LQKVFDFSIENGINWFDTADSYGTGSLTGRSEKLLGEFYSQYFNNNNNNINNNNNNNKNNFFLSNLPNTFASILNQNYNKNNYKINKNNIHFCTKIAPFPWRLTKNSFLETFEKSKQNLQKPQIDIIQLHWPPIFNYQENEFYSALEEIIEKKESYQIGLSNYGPKKLEKVYNILNNKNGNKIYTNQVSIFILVLFIIFYI
jgi:pyridoxine 4-dehydrogenase